MLIKLCDFLYVVSFRLAYWPANILHAITDGLRCGWRDWATEDAYLPIMGDWSGQHDDPVA